MKIGKVKYIYTNSKYKETECKAMWEGGCVDLGDVEVKNVSGEFYQTIEKNGKLIRERRLSTGAVSKWR